MTSFKPNFFDKEHIIFLSFEGIEGSGKSTQIKLLKESLECHTDFNIYHFREPGGTDFGENLRSAVLGSKNKIAPLSEAHLFAASRCQLLTEKVIPLNGQKGNIVIYDRYIHSSIAYQGFGSGLGHQTVLNIHSQYPLNIIPHLTLYLEIDLETSLDRQEVRNNKKDYFESKEKEFYQNVIDGFNWCKQNLPNFKTINGTKTLPEVRSEIFKSVMELIDEK